MFECQQCRQRKKKSFDLRVRIVKGRIMRKNESSKNPIPLWSSDKELLQSNNTRYQISNVQIWESTQRYFHLKLGLRRFKVRQPYRAD